MSCSFPPARSQHGARARRARSGIRTDRACKTAKPESRKTGDALGRLRTMHVSMEGHTDTIRALVPLPLEHPRSPLFVSGSSDGTLRVWDPEAREGGALSVLRGHTGGIYALTCFHLMSADLSGGFYVVSGAFDNTLRLWDPLRRGEALAVLHGHKGTVDALESFVLMPRATQCVASSSGAEVRIWGIAAPPSGSAWEESISTLLVIPVASRVRGLSSFSVGLAAS